MLKINREMSKVRVTIQQIENGKALNGAGWSTTLYECTVAEVSALIQAAIDNATDSPVAPAVPEFTADTLNPLTDPANTDTGTPDVTPEPVVKNGKVKVTA